MKKTILCLLLFTTVFSKAQNVIDWNGIYKLQLSDFQSKATEIGNTNIYSLHSSSKFDFSYYMNNYEFMFTKNFNSKVNCTFTKDGASLVAPDQETAMSLLNFAQYEFDLAELYARKLRKKIYEEKGVFSDPTFFQPIYESIQKQYVEEYTIAAKETDIGKNQEKLKILHENVLKEIQELPNFCKTCKPTKAKK